MSEIPLVKVLVVGQVPPPWGGQAVMIKKLLDAKLDGVELSFVPMSFSSDMDEIGRFRWKKILRLPVLIARIWRQRIKTKCSILYYPPGGESLTSIVRDIVVLLSCRMLFRKVVFHVHAGGFTEVADAASYPVRILAYWAYKKVDLVVQLTEKSPPDGLRIKAKKVVFVPNGLEDNGARFLAESQQKQSTDSIRLLFVGVVSPSKGIRILLEACAKLHSNGIHFSLRVMGRFYSPDFERECRSFVDANGLGESVNFIGVRTGDEKWAEFEKADAFCFPSFFESENQSLVVLEAMQFGLPCIATDWRGMSTMIVDGETGYLVPIKEVGKLAESVETLAKNPELRHQMGIKARDRFLCNYTDDVWRSRMEIVLKEVCS